MEMHIFLVDISEYILFMILKKKKIKQHNALSLK